MLAVCWNDDSDDDADNAERTKQVSHYITFDSQYHTIWVVVLDSDKNTDFWEQSKLENSFFKTYAHEHDQGLGWAGGGN